MKYANLKKLSLDSIVWCLFINKNVLLFKILQLFDELLLLSWLFVLFISIELLIILFLLFLCNLTLLIFISENIILEH
jgi:hypothetical protein